MIIAELPEMKVEIDQETETMIVTSTKENQDVSSVVDEMSCSVESKEARRKRQQERQQKF